MLLDFLFLRPASVIQQCEGSSRSVYGTHPELFPVREVR